MKFIKEISSFLDDQVELEDALYAAVLNEVKSGMVMKNLWTKSMAHSDFDANKTRAFYIRERVSRLKKKYKPIKEYLRLVEQEAEFTNAKEGKGVQPSRDFAETDETLEARNKILNSYARAAIGIVGVILYFLKLNPLEILGYAISALALIFIILDLAKKRPVKKAKKAEGLAGASKSNINDRKLALENELQSLFDLEPI